MALEGEPLIYAGSGPRAAAGTRCSNQPDRKHLFLALETPAHPWSLCPIVFWLWRGRGMMLLVPEVSL